MAPNSAEHARLASSCAITQPKPAETDDVVPTISSDGLLSAAGTADGLDAANAANASTLQEASMSDVEIAMHQLSRTKAEWAHSPLKEKMALLKEVNQRLLDSPLAYSRQCSKATGNEGNAKDLPMQLIKNSMITSTYIQSLIKVLSTLDKTGALPTYPLVEQSKHSGSGAVFDTTSLSPGMLKSVATKVETYLQPGAEPSQGSSFQSPHDGRVSVCLGAGNQAFLSIIDILDRMFIGGDVVWFKYHPVLECTAPFQEHILAPLASRGYYVGNIAGVDVTREALQHPSTGWMHMTGGGATHDAIVWGPTSQIQEQNKAADTPILKVPVTSELGCVTPWMVVPGPWTAKELQHYAKHLAGAFGDNLSCNCLSPKVVILAKGWEHTEEFISIFKETMAAYPLLAPYYPGIHARYAKFKAAYPDAVAFENKVARHVDVQKFGKPLPWLVNELELELQSKPSAEWASEPAFAEEPFAPVITFLKLDLPDTDSEDLVDRFLARVPQFCNQNLFGTLSCTVLVHPKTEAAKGTSVSAAMGCLQYGSVVKNEFSATSYLIPGAHWGGFQTPEITTKNAGSGIGSVWNLGLYDYVQKSDVHCPWMSASQAKPPHEMSIPLWVAKIIVGLYVDGMRGLAKMFFFSK